MVLVKKLRARFRNASKHLEINIGVLRNRDVTKTRGSGEQFWAAVLTKESDFVFKNKAKALFAAFQTSYENVHILGAMALTKGRLKQINNSC